MSYADMVAITRSESLAARLRMCAVQQIPPDVHPGWWVDRHIDRLATRSGWAAAWGKAVTKGTEDPGADESVISDAMLLDGVNALLAADSQAEQAKDQAAADKAAAEAAAAENANAARLAREDEREERREARRLRMQHLAQSDPDGLARIAGLPDPAVGGGGPGADQPVKPGRTGGK